MEHHDRLFSLAELCAERLQKLNDAFPHLTNNDLQECVSYWHEVRQNLAGRVVVVPKKEPERSSGPEVVSPSEEENRERVRKLALELLENNGLEDTLDKLRINYKVNLNIKGMIVLIGKRAYAKALRDDAKLLRNNAISFVQIADLWNDLERPAFGGNQWSAQTVSMLFD